MPMSDSLLSTVELDLLRKYDTPTICNVIELFKVRPQTSGYMDARIKACFPELPPMVGYAATATFRAGSPAQSNVYATLDRQIAAFEPAPSPPILVFQDLDDPSVAATFGEVMCTAYRSFGASGLITSGSGRDMDQVRALRFPVFTNGIVCARGYSHIPSIQVPVSVGGMAVNPGDLLHGDCNGVTIIPSQIASEVANACADYVRAEAIILEYSRSEQVTVKGLSEARAEYLALIEELRQRLRSDRKTLIHVTHDRGANVCHPAVSVQR
jgi:4-hydroxy-4-methyl-2-oxoglutarate aldolase